MKGDKATAHEAPAQLRRVLEAVERGELTGSTPEARALVRQIHGAAVALDAASKRTRE